MTNKTDIKEKYDADTQNKKNSHFRERRFKRRSISILILLFVLSVIQIISSHQNLTFDLNHRIIDNYSYLNRNDTTINDKPSLSFNEDSLPYPPRPKLILHIGPPKTGTSSIQCGLARFSGTLAQMDNYFFMGTACTVATDQYNIQNLTGSKPIKPYVDLFIYIVYQKRDPPSEVMEFFEEHHRQNHSIILSSEKFYYIDDSEETLTRLRNVFPSDKWDMQVIVTYRPYYEWIPSMFYQTLELEKKARVGILTLPDYAHRRWKRKENKDATIENIILKEHPTIYSALTYGQKFPVILFEYHQSDDDDDNGEDLVTNFICHAIPDTHHTCDFIRQSNITNANVRVSTNRDLWYITRGAFERGILKQRADIKSRGAIQLKLNTMYDDINPPPQACLTEEEERFLGDISYAAEKYIMTENQQLFSRMILKHELNGEKLHHDNSNNNNEWEKLRFRLSSLWSAFWNDKNAKSVYDEKERKKQHLQGLNEWKKKGKFCSLDLRNIFQSRVWQKIFEEINDEVKKETGNKRKKGRKYHKYHKPR